MSSTDYGGDYSSYMAAAEKAYEQALSLYSQQRQSLLQRYGYNADGSLDKNNPYGMYQQIEHGYGDAQWNYGINVDKNGNWTLDPSRYGTMQQIAHQYGQMQTDAGMRAGKVVGADGMPTRVVQTTNPHGQWQNLLSGEGQQLDAARDQSLDRGIGTTGVAARGSKQLAFMQAGDRQGFRQQLLDQLVGNRVANNNAGEGIKNMIYQHGVNQANLGWNLTDALSGLQQNQYAAQSTYDNSWMQGLLSQVQSNIGAGNYPVTSAMENAYNSGGYNPYMQVGAAAPSGIGSQSAAAKALAARSSWLNQRYGLGQGGG